VVPVAVALILLLAVGFKVASILHPDPAEIIRMKTGTPFTGWLSTG
jgi:hypothetical protein